MVGIETSEKVVSNILINMGIPANLKGFKYLKDAVGLVLEYGDEIKSVVRDLYNPIAEKHNVSANKVERCIRTAVDHMNYNMPLTETVAPFRGKMFGYSNSEIIFLIVEYMTVRHNNEGA